MGPLNHAAAVGAGLALVVASAPLHAAVPDASAVQQAYDAAKNEPGPGAGPHVYELDIGTTKCSTLAQTAAYVCQIDFVRRDEPAGRLYFDVVTLEQRGGRWFLLTGLCKTRWPLR